MAKPKKKLFHPSSTETLIKALRILAVDIQSGDGVANAAIEEAAGRMEKMLTLIDGAYDLVEIHPTEGQPYNTEWKARWLKDARACGAGGEPF